MNPTALKRHDDTLGSNSKSFDQEVDFLLALLIPHDRLYWDEQRYVAVDVSDTAQWASCAFSPGLVTAVVRRQWDSRCHGGGGHGGVSVREDILIGPVIAYREAGLHIRPVDHETALEFPSTVL